MNFQTSNRVFFRKLKFNNFFFLIFFFFQVTDVSLYALPKRRTDDSSVLDMAEHHTKLYLTEGGVKRIRRTSDGKVEKQFRLVLGDLPVAYTSEQNGKVLYIMKDSVKEYTPKDVTYGERNLPPCIQVIEEGRNVQLLLSVSTTGMKSKIGIYNIFDSRLKVKVKPFCPFSPPFSFSLQSRKHNIH